MSIVPLVKVTVYGPIAEKVSILADLQALGCLHLVSLQAASAAVDARPPSPQARQALQFLQRCPQRRRQVHDQAVFDPQAVEHQVLALQRQIAALEDERDGLRRRLAALQPWGDFVLPPVEDLHGLRLWFYQVPHYEMSKVVATDLYWQLVGRDNQFAYVVVIAADEPHGMPVARTHTGSASLAQLQRHLESVELALDEAQAARVSLTRWCDLLARSLDRLEDRAALAQATQHTYDQPPLFALQGWAPRAYLTQIQTYSTRHRLGLEIDTPTPAEQPPTLLRNRPTLAAGQDLVSFYMTPGYWTWDPSTLVLLSFALFFAMILSDAGYAALLGLGLLLGWRRLGRTAAGQRRRVLFAVVVSSSAAWGVLAGSYFGLPPSSGTLLAALQVFDLNDQAHMMQVSIGVGIAHVIIANLAAAWRQGLHTAAALAPLGWVTILLGATVIWIGGSSASTPVVGLDTAGFWVMGLGALAVLLFTRVQATVPGRLLQGLLALTRVLNVFGDVLSYLRLFALGLASASLAVAFNDLAAQLAAAGPGVGRLGAVLIVLFGHSLNLLLGIVSGFVHGLRLNFIEFFNWGIPEEGYPFRAFAKKETDPWSRSS